MGRKLLRKLLISLVGFQNYNLLSNWWYKKTLTCDLCGKTMMRFGTYYGIDIKDGIKTHHAFVCGLCNKLIK